MKGTELIDIAIRGSLGVLTCDGKARQLKGTRRGRKETVK